MASGEWVVVVVLPRKDGTGEVNVSVRGMMPDGLELRPNVKLVEGRWFTPGQREVVVGRNIHSRFSGTNVGDTLDFGKGKWTVVGVFDSGGTAYDSEIWGDVNQMAPTSTARWAYCVGLSARNRPGRCRRAEESRQRRSAAEARGHAGN